MFDDVQTEKYNTTILMPTIAPFSHFKNLYYIKIQTLVYKCSIYTNIALESSSLIG